jgi:hypothetical protein
MRTGRNLRIALFLSVAAVAVTSASSASAATVCNEAGNGQRGDYVVSGGTVDPTPPARYTAGLKPLGSNQAQGLDRAADRSPALRQCAPPGDDTGTT